MGNSPIKLSEDSINRHNKYTATTKESFGTSLKDMQTFQSDFCIVSFFLLHDSRLYVQGISNISDYIELGDTHTMLSLFERTIVMDGVNELVKVEKKGIDTILNNGKRLSLVLDSTKEEDE